MSSFRRILVATDGSASCGRAVETAVDLARALGASLVALSVDGEDADRGMTEPSDPLGGAEAAAEALGRRDADGSSRAETRARAVAAEASGGGVDATWRVWQGPVGDSILAAAAAEKADLIVVGSHCRGAVGRLVLGSVSEYVVQHAPIPVMVVRPGPSASPTPAAPTPASSDPAG